MSDWISMKSSGARTVTMPRRSRSGPEPVTALRRHGHAGAGLNLPLEQERFSLGSSACDVVIESEYVSALHCMLTRRGHRMTVIDQHSRNGTFFHGERSPLFEIGSGDVFEVARTSLLAMSGPMQRVRSNFAEVIGFDADAEIDDLLIAAAGTEPIAIFGEPDCGQQRLVRAIHRASPFRSSELLEESAPPRPDSYDALVERARGATLALPLVGNALGGDFVSALFDPARDVRVVVTAKNADTAVKALGHETLKRFHQITLRPLRARRADIGRLFDRLFIEHSFSLRFTDLTAENQATLRAHTWKPAAKLPGNFDGVSEWARRIGAIVAAGGEWTKAAVARGIAKSTFEYWLRRSKLEMPLVREGVATARRVRPSTTR